MILAVCIGTLTRRSISFLAFHSTSTSTGTSGWTGSGILSRVGCTRKSSLSSVEVGALRGLVMSTVADPHLSIGSDSLPNALKIIVHDGQVEVSLSENTIATTLETKQAPLQKKRKVANGEKTDGSDVDKDGEIPDSVLQYERQLRKVQADQRSVAEISLEKHLHIVYEDSDLIVADKPSGVLCVPGLYNKPNLLQLVCQHISNQKQDGTTTAVEAKSDMIVHRLDMDTSGLVVFSKTTTALKGLHTAFRDRKVVVKEYHALLCGHLPEEWQRGNVHLPLQRDHRHPPFMRVATPRSEAEAHRAVQDLQTHGFRKLVKKRPKPSHTEFRILQREYFDFPVESFNMATTLWSDACVATFVSADNRDTIRIPVTRVALTPHTGRTHQLRVHCAALGFPIVSDPAYGLYGEAQARGGLDEEDPGHSSSSMIGATLVLQQTLNTCRPSHENTMCLHAAKLGLKHPISGKDLVWTAPTPF